MLQRIINLMSFHNKRGRHSLFLSPDHCIMASNSFQWERRHCLGKGSGALGITRSAHEHFDEILQEILEMLGGSEGGLFAIEGHVLADRGPV